MTKKAILIILPVFIILAGFYFLFRVKPVDVTVFRVKKGEVESTVTATTTGTVQARALSKISSQYTGRIKRILKRDGERVKKGETLLEIENNDANAQLRLAEANLRGTKTELSQLLLSRDMVVSQASSTLNQTRAKLDNAAANLDRANSLYTKGMISKQEMDSAKSTFDVAQADYESARANELQGKMKDEEIKTARARVEQMESNLQLAGVQLGRTYITAPYSGIITELFVEEGELLSIGTPVLEMADESTMEVDAVIDEVDVGKLRIGQDVKLTFDAFKEKQSLGKILEISPYITTTKEQNRTVNIKVGITTGQDGILVGMSTDVEVITGRAKDVLYLPTNAIIEKADGQFVFIAEKGVAKEKKIKTGLSNWDTSEVIEGLREGDEVITSLEIKKFTDGTKIKVADKD
ncbi:MAG: efflux RND transporter periplasmic adaptor subunit [Deltaproteobacteria bacterium]